VTDSPLITSQEPPWLKGLNPPQREAVLTTEGPVLLLAGAGTGKTAALTARMAQILAQRLAWPSEILAVTFTNKAAREMKERIGHMVGDVVEGMPWLGTFHNIGAKMLRRHAELLGLQSNFTIIDTDDQLRLLKQLIRSEDIDDKRFPPKLLASLIDKWKNKGLSPSDIDAGESEAFANGKGQHMYVLYQARLRTLNACDFGDLLLHGLNLLRQHRDVLEEYQRRFKYILVDEYQDTNAVQYLWLRLLAQARKNICCVGDDDQCLIAGTMVTMADGQQKAIEEIKVGDAVLSCFGSGDFRPAPVSRATCSTGERAMVRINTASGREIISTAQHVHFADFVAAESQQRHFTYLMVKKDFGYRLGTSQTYTNGQKRAVIGFRQRCLQEQGDAVWLIGAFDSEQEARLCEHRLSLKYGITTLPFVARKGKAVKGLVHDQALLDALHRELDSEPKAMQLLADFHLDPAEPHHVPQSAHGKRRIFNLTLYAEKRGSTPMHRMSVSGNDDEGRLAIDAAGLNARRYKRNPANWRFETLYRDMAKVEDIKTRLSEKMELVIRRKANLLGKPLALRKAGHVCPAMVVAGSDGKYDPVETVAHFSAATPVYDLDIDGTHNFIANGIVTHNSIYSWRGAEVANILRFEKDFPGAKIIKLEQNYRSTPHILAAASGLINANSDRLGKTLWTELEEGEKPRIIGVWDGPEEARRVGEEIEALQHKGSSLDSMAILVRAQFQTREFEDRFIQIGLNYKIVGGFRFYERSEIRDAIGYLRVINQPADDLAFERIVNTPKRGIGDKAVEKIHIVARGAGIPLSMAAARIVGTDELSGKARKSLGDLVIDIARWRDEAGRMTPADLIRQVLAESGYEDSLKTERSVEAAGRLENLNELARAMEEYETLGEFLEHVSLVMDNDSRTSGESVTVMTIHAAKGLEFENLFLVGWEDGVFPSQRALDEGGMASLEEERRLAYVAITRARCNCTILHAANRRIYGQWTSSIPSRFIAELPEEHVENEQSMTGGASLWRANWSERADPFAHLAASNATRAAQRGPGWQRAATSGGFNAGPVRVAEANRSAVSLGNKGRSDVSVGLRVFHEKFGYGVIAEIEGNKLEIDFEAAGRKRVMDAFVSTG
jgi:DNA helicase II / ATP-dependent DNA helicase PcrA